MHHFPVVQLCEGAGRLRDDPDGRAEVAGFVHGDHSMDRVGVVSGQVVAASPDHLLKSGPLDIRHGHVGEALDVAELEDLKQRWAGELRTPFGLAPELGEAVGLRR